MIGCFSTQTTLFRVTSSNAVTFLHRAERGSERGGKRERPLNKVTDVDGLGQASAA